MSKGYWLAIYRAIHDQDQLAEYAKKATVAIAEHGGTFLSRGMPEAHFGLLYWRFSARNAFELTIITFARFRLKNVKKPVDFSKNLSFH